MTRYAQRRLRGLAARSNSSSAKCPSRLGARSGAASRPARATVSPSMANGPASRFQHPWHEIDGVIDRRSPRWFGAPMHKGASEVALAPRIERTQVGLSL
jgi:hypothetical protein